MSKGRGWISYFDRLDRTIVLIKITLAITWIVIIILLIKGVL